MSPALTASDLALDPESALRIVAWCEAFERDGAAAEPWRLHGWARDAATRVGAISARRIERALRLGPTLVIASGRPVAADAGQACRTAARALLDDPRGAAPRFVAWVLASLCASTARIGPDDAELMLVDDDAGRLPFEATLLRGRALDDAAGALLGLALAAVPPGGPAGGSPWVDLARLARASAGAGTGPAAARTLVQGLLEETAVADAHRPAPRTPHRLMRGALDAVADTAARGPIAVAFAPPIAGDLPRRPSPRVSQDPTAPGPTLPDPAPPCLSRDAVADDDARAAAHRRDDGLEALREAHRAALAQPFAVCTDAAAEAGFDAAATTRLAQFGHWYERLADGRLSPMTDAQRRFVAAARGEIAPIGEHERLWCAYLSARRRVDEVVRRRPAAARGEAAPTPASVETSAPAATSSHPPASRPATPPSAAPTTAPAAPAARASASSRMLAATCTRATDEERLELTRALAGHDGAARALDPAALAWRIGLAGHRGLTAPARPGGATYLEMLRDAAEVLAVDSVWWSPRDATDGRDLASLDLADTLDASPRDRDAAAALHGWVDELETELLKAVLDLLQPSLDDVGRSRFVRDVLLRARRHGLDLTDSFTAAGALVTVHLGGFATYTALATALAIAGADRIELAGRTLASSLLCALLGPDGRTLLEARPAWHAIDLPARRVIRLVATVAMIRQGAATSATAATARRPERLEAA